MKRFVAALLALMLLFSLCACGSNDTEVTVGESIDPPEKEELKVSTINAEMQFLDSEDKPAGDKFTEFVFSEEYENPVTGEKLPEGLISVYVQAVVPKGYAVDYWKINDVPYHFDSTVNGFTVFDLNETTVYEVVLKEVKAPTSTPTQSSEPVTYYDVYCSGCVFSGGGYSNVECGSVPAGTVITVTSTVTYSDSIFWSGSINDGYNWQPSYTRTHTYTVNSDCEFCCYGVIN